MSDDSPVVLVTGAGWRHQVGPGSDVARLLFSVLPGVYDRITGPAMAVLAQELGGKR